MPYSDLSARPFDGVLFDMDGLMFETEHCYYQANVEICRRRGCSFAPELLSLMQGKLATETMPLVVQFYGWSDDPQDLLKERNAIYEVLLETQAAPCAGLFEILDLLERHNVRKAVATASMPEYAALLLGRYDLEGRFEAVVTGKDVSRGKPAPDLFLKAAQRLALSPSRCCVLEDTQNGIDAAKAGGFDAVWIPNQHSGPAGTSAADMIAPSLADKKLHDYLTAGLTSG